MLTVNKILDHSRLEWARPEQCDQRNDILETVRPEVLNQFLHAAAFQLEYGRRFSALQQVVNRTVIEWYLINIHRRLDITSLVNHRHCPINDGQRPKAQEVEFDETRVLNIVLVILCDKTLPLCIAKEGREISQFRRSNYHTARMLTGVSGKSLKLDGHVPNFLSCAVLLQQVRQLIFLFNRLFERHPHFKRNQLGHLVGKCVRLILNPGDITHDGFCRHRSKGNNLRYRVSTVGICDVINDLIAPVHAEIDVEVRH